MDRLTGPLRLARTALALLALTLVVHGVAQAQRSGSGAAAWPLPLELRVPFEPTAFPSAGHTYLTYELYLTNFGTTPLTLRRVVVRDADAAAAEPLALFEDGQLNTLLQRVGDPIVGDQIPASGDNAQRQVIAGGTVVVYLSIALERGAHVPNKLRHRVLTADSAVEGAVIGTHRTELRVLGPPLGGSHWLAGSGPSNDSHHRRGIVVLNGHAVISRRYAIDWLQIENGAAFSGDEHDNRSYYAYGKNVLAVADGTVVTAQDGIPENTAGSRPAPKSFAAASGNVITLDLGGGQFAHYMHLQMGSLQVKAGDRVRRGQVLARLGNSGDSKRPHLHFEVTTAPNLLAGEGVPYLIDKFRLAPPADGAIEQRTRELPLKDTLVSFEGSRDPSDRVR
jgi:Peptidase family M23